MKGSGAKRGLIPTPPHPWTLLVVGRPKAEPLWHLAKREAPLVLFSRSGDCCCRFAADQVLLISVIALGGR